MEEKIGILNELTESQLNEVECAVTKWKECGAPGIFGFVSASDLDEIKQTAVTAYKKELSVKVETVAVLSTILIVGGIILKKSRNKKKKK